ncbi:hypothetical protein [Coleofasciculus sp. E1-EBD-02]|uniref:hypothetical protein n=1 Tax=Coleofasciculus sp. E1-EBD-02 TaxID=3068481 RepID=UPI0032FDD240
MKARLVAVVHDETVEVVQEGARVLEECMVQTRESVLMPIPCVVDVGVLKSWGSHLSQNCKWFRFL